MKDKKIASEIVRRPGTATFIDEELWRKDSLFRRFKPVPGPTDRAQIPGMFRVNLNLGAQFSYIDIHRARADEGSLPPNGVKYLVPGKDPASVLRKIVQKPELGCRSRNNRAADGKDHGHGVNFKIA